MIVTMLAVYTHNAYREIVVDDLVSVKGSALEVFDAYSRVYGLGIFPKIC